MLASSSTYAIDRCRYPTFLPSIASDALIPRQHANADIALSKPPDPLIELQVKGTSAHKHCTIYCKLSSHDAVYATASCYCIKSTQSSPRCISRRLIARSRTQAGSYILEHAMIELSISVCRDG